MNVPTTNPESYWQRAVYLPPTDHLIQEINDRLLSREDHFLAQYLLPTNLQGLGNDVQSKMYRVYSRDLTDKREHENEMLRCKTEWPHSTEERTTTLADTLDCINPTLYRKVNTILTILLTMPLSTATPERSFSLMRRVKTYLRATIWTERLSALARVQGYIHWRGGRGSWVLRQEK